METKKIGLSVALAVYNEEKNLDVCLASIASVASEIIVVDGGSTDKTAEVAHKYHAKIIRTDNPPIFHINKQKALDACTQPWILQLDADEIVPEELKKEIITTIMDDRPLMNDHAQDNKSHINNQKSIINGYYIPRHNYFWGHLMKKGGQYPDYVIRLIKRGKAHFPCKSVHEQIEVDGNIGYLKAPLKHISYRTSRDYWRKADTYTSLNAAEMKQSKIPNTFYTWILYNVIKPGHTFYSLYLRHGGFLDGWHGLVFAWWSALHYPIAYKKYLKL